MTTTTTTIQTAAVVVVSPAPVVEVQVHAYRVDLGEEVRPRYHVVRKDRSCDCELGADCPAVDAVRAYLRAGGRRAPDPPANSKSRYWATVPERCPICDGPTTLDRLLNSRRHGLGWRCLSDAAHYWELRTRWLREAQARAYARSPDAPGLPDVPRMTAEERAAFIEAHRLDYNAWA